MKKTEKVCLGLLAFAMTVSAAFGVSGCVMSSPDQTSGLVTQLEEKVNLNKAELDKKIADLIAEYKAKDEELLVSIETNEQALSALKAAYVAKITELATADSANQKAITDLTAAYEAKVEKLQSADGENATALANLKTAYNAKVAELAGADTQIKAQIAQVEEDYLAKTADLQGQIDTANAKIESNKTALEQSIADLEKAYNKKISDIESVIATIQNKDGTQDEKIAELERQVAELLAVDLHTVTFNPDNGENEFIQTIGDNEKASAPTQPTKEGYEFLGWFVGEEKWSFVGHSVTEDIELVAKWEETYTKGLEFYLMTDGTYGVMGGTTMYMSEVVIPSMYQGVAVTRILPEAFKGASVSSVIIPNTITRIDKYAFYQTALTSVLLPSGLTYIGEYAFTSCSSLKKVLIPNSVVFIGEHAFASLSGKFYCEATTQPSGWNSSWAYNAKNVYWYSENKPADSYNYYYWYYDENHEIVIWKK